MAIGVGSLVSVRGLASAQSGKGPLFGISESAGTPFTITWETGERVASIPSGSLDEITAADATTQNTFVGRMCKPTSPTGQTNWGQGVCVSCYKRNTDTVALLKNTAGFFLEVLTSALEVV